MIFLNANCNSSFSKVWVKQYVLFGGTHTGFLEDMTFNITKETSKNSKQRGISGLEEDTDLGRVHSCINSSQVRREVTTAGHLQPRLLHQHSEAKKLGQV